MTSDELDDALLKLMPQFSRFIDQPISKDGVDIVGWHCSIELTAGGLISSGTRETRELARRVAIAEAFERALFRRLADGNDTERFNLKKVPTSSGFASGFEDKATRFRAICEGIERWAWSQWIDRGLFIPKAEVSVSELSPLSKHFSQKFKQVHFYKLDVPIPIMSIQTGPLQFGVVLGETDKGVFAGSRVTSPGDDLWTHGFVEAIRNLNNFNLGYVPENKLAHWYTNRVNYFGRNKAAAFEQIPNANSGHWPNPKVDLLEKYETGIKGIYLWRCLFEDFMPWHLGPKTRFVY